MIHRMKNKKENIHPVYDKYLYRFNKSMTLACDSFLKGDSDHYKWINEHATGMWTTITVPETKKKGPMAKVELWFEFEEDAVRYKLVWL